MTAVRYCYPSPTNRRGLWLFRFIVWLRPTSFFPQGRCRTKRPKWRQKLLSHTHTHTHDLGWRFRRDVFRYTSLRPETMGSCVSTTAGIAIESSPGWHENAEFRVRVWRRMWPASWSAVSDRDDVPGNGVKPWPKTTGFSLSIPLSDRSARRLSSPKAVPRTIRPAAR